ncbi:guanine nucleotide-binding protein subunit alpha-11-like isoform X1 [Schistocerca cancellata]|uniref:guanine nucleotide-binding protein subunit alpha-11-like isoform X1 n=1 Tax=Schistocerca cancellata TaxID=274614 RepID=UPI002117B4F2|nr:guanine nucleotide-binding protein subunit alpha-11-like isoform X1 [Schistocerca cancellata]
MDDAACCSPLRVYLERRDVERLLEKSRRAYLRLKSQDVKTILLGCGSSGKSTFMKQVRIIEEGGFQEAERMTYKPIICQNIISEAQKLIMAMELYGFPYELETTEECARRIMDINVGNVTEMDDELLAAIREVWNDANVQICYDRRDELYLLDSTKYYMERLDIIGAAGYIPTVQDVVRSRSPTTSIVEYKVPVENYDRKLCIVDVGGQRTERPKWLHCFENCVAFIFISAISEYNQLDERGQNRLSVSLALFSVLLTCSAFRYASVIVFLNKIDVFDEKIMKYDLCNYFPEYTGPKQDAEAAKNFIADKFQECCEKERNDDNKGVYIRYTCATDTKNIEAVFSTVRDFIIKKMLEQCHVF